MEDAEIRKKLRDDTVFNCINKQYISLQERDVKRNNIYLNQAITTLIEEMKFKDELFNEVYERIDFGGSFYKGTKISAPTEFDLDIIIKLPINYNYVTFSSDRPGFTKVLVQPNVFTRKLNERKQRVLARFINDGYINQEYFRRWIEGIVTKVITGLPKRNGKYVLHVTHNEAPCIVSRKSGPAFTIILHIPGEEIMSVDLVPALAFRQSIQNAFCRARWNEFRNQTWLLVPKPLYEMDCHANHYWRFSFYKQEKEILGKYGRLKPVIRQIKKLRDVQNWKSVASYYIETLALHEVEFLQDFDRMPLTLLLFTMLNKLHEAFMLRRLEYYWDTRLNLLEKIRTEEITNMERRLNNIIKNITRNIKIDSLIIAKYILTPYELQMLKVTSDDTTANEPPEEASTFRCILL